MALPEFFTMGAAMLKSCLFSIVLIYRLGLLVPLRPLIFQAAEFVQLRDRTIILKTGATAIAQLDIPLRAKSHVNKERWRLTAA